MTQDARRCSARRQDGQPCRAWAVRDSDPALCANHLKQQRQEKEASDFYERAYDLDEVADLLYKAEEKDLKDEVRVTRVAVRRLLDQLRQELDPAEYARLIGLIFKGTQTIADIMRVQRGLSGDNKDLIPPAVDYALTEINRERGTKL